MSSLEQQSRNLLERAGVPRAQSYTAGNLVELCELLSPLQRKQGTAYIKFDAIEVVAKEGKATATFYRANKFAFSLDRIDYVDGQILNLRGIEGTMQISLPVPE